MADRIADIAGLPENQLTLLCVHLFAGERRAGYVEPTDEGILVVSCGESDHGDGPEDWVSAGFGTLAHRDPTLRDCPPVPLGQAAERGTDGLWCLVAAADDGPGPEDHAPQDEL